MKRHFARMFSAMMILALVFSGLPMDFAKASSTSIVISEFRVRGPNGAADEFVELYNLSSAPVDVGGWLIRGSNSSGTVGTRATIPSGTVINPGCYYLVTNSSTSGGPYSGAVPGDLTFATGITDDGGIAVTLPGGTTIVDQVGMSAGSAYKEGTPLASLGSSNLDRGYERKPGSVDGNGTDTDNNSSDFQLITPSNPQNSASPCVDTSTSTPPIINEFVFNHVGTDTHEYVEILGDPNTDYSAYSILQIEGDTTGAGVIDSVHTIGTTDANGYWFTGFLTNVFENGTVTLLLVKDFTGAVGNNLDTNNDGVFDTTPWEAIVDSIAVNDGGAGDITYGPVTLGVAYDGLPFAPGGASRIPDGTDTDTVADWVRNDFDGEGLPGFIGTPEFGEAFNTPGAVNAAVPPVAVGNVVISQIYGGGGNSGATYTHDFIELYNQTSSSVDLTGWSVQYASATGSSWNVTALSGSIAPGGYYLIQQAAGAGGTTPLPTPDATGSAAMAAGAGKVALVNIATALSGTCPTGESIIDFVGYGTTASCFEGIGPAPAPSNTTAIFRKDGGNQDTDNNNADFETGVPNPRNSSFGAGDDAPEVVSTFPLDDATDFPTTGNITVTFSEPVDVTGTWFELICTTSGTVLATVSGGPTTFTLNPDADLVAGETCTLTIYAANVTDQDANDPPDNMEADYSITFSVLNACILPFTPIYDIQGSGPVAAITGPVITQGVVVGDYEGPSPTLRGFYIQDPDGDGDPATSDGIFVFNGNNNNVNLGDLVRVTGTAGEFQDQTQISNVTSIVPCGTGTVEPADVYFPIPSADYLERYEGMLVRLPQTMFVTEHFQLGRFGQVLLSSGGRLQQPTNVVDPGPDALALQAANDLNKIILDDALQNQNPDPILFARGGLPLSASK
ncbi:MAG TPA: lamin tail domain-containing protein, partial [Anaerolineales bacterium]|nr:lamin tail domain-containing protein [Anaerolineales bacterium]